MIKDKPLPEVLVEIRVPAGETVLFKGRSDANGRLVLDVPTGAYRVSYKKAGYVAIQDSPMEVRGPTKLTISMTMMMEAAGQAGRRRIQVVLNWGDGDGPHVRDADLYLACPWGPSMTLVSFSERTRSHEKSSAELDVDDMDYGGPETITLLDPPRGDYIAWVHSYSGPPEVLGESKVRIRVLDGDRVLGEFSPPTLFTAREWRPFKALHLDESGTLEIVAFDEKERAAGAAASLPAGLESAEGYYGCGSIYGCLGMMGGGFAFFFVFFVFMHAKRASSRR